MLRHLLRRRRLELGLLQREVAICLDVTTNSYGDYERKNRHPREQTLRKLSDALAIPWVDILCAVNTTLTATPVKWLKPLHILTAQCGTLSGPNYHQQRGEPCCDLCTEIRRVYKINARRARGVKAKNIVAPCGTDSGYVRHRRQGTKVCADCLDAHREYHRAYSGNQPLSPALCGTISGYRKHLRDGSEPCRECRAANAADSAMRRQNRL